MEEIVREIRDFARDGIVVNTKIVIPDDLFWKIGITVVATVMLSTFAYYFVKSKF